MTSEVPVYADEFGSHVYICPRCGQAGGRGDVCDSEIHQPPNRFRMVPSTAVATAYCKIYEALANPDERSGGTVAEWEAGEVSPSAAEMLQIAAELDQPLHTFFYDHGKAGELWT